MAKVPEFCPIGPILGRICNALLSDRKIAFDVCPKYFDCQCHKIAELTSDISEETLKEVYQ